VLIMKKQSGFSLIELMVAIAVGMVIVAALSLLFANNSRARQEMEKTSQQIENGRYATMTLRDDLRLAGYYGEMSTSGLAVPAAVPDPSDTTDAGVSDALRIAVQGYHFGKDGTLNSTVPAGVTALLTDLRPNTDIIVLRRTSTCYAGEASCSAMDTSTQKYFQTTLCATHLQNITNATKLFVIGTDAPTFSTSNANISGLGYAPVFLAKRDCATAAVTRAFYVHIYYVANNDVAGDGIPTLKMVSLGANSFGAPVAIAEGIETLQVEYGVDTDADGTPDSWSADPGFGLAAGPAATAWSQVTAVKLHVLARNPQSSPQWSDTRAYVLGTTSTADNTFGPFNDAYKRHVYSNMARVVNVAGRLE
jgi:type IV pilus assembly protein PilW